MKQILIFSILLFSFSSLKAQSKDVLQFIEEYQSVAHQKINGSQFSIEKWEDTDSLYYFIVGELVHLPNKSLIKYLAQIKDLTGIAFKKTMDRNQADIIMYFGDLKDYFPYINSNTPINLTNNFDNWNNRKYTPNKQLTSASFCVDPSKTKTPDRFRKLIKRGVLKSIGFWGQSDSEYSMFYKYNTKYNLRLHKNDKKIIKLHYNSNIKAGMTVGESRETILENIDVELLLKQKL